MTDKTTNKTIPTIPIITKPLEKLAKEIEKRGNRLEIMNGKAYEVTRKLIGKTE